MFSLIHSQFLHIVILSQKLSQVTASLPLVFEFNKEWLIEKDSISRSKFHVGLDQVIRVETQSVDRDSLYELIKVVLLVNSRPESFLADWTVAPIGKPLINAFAVKYVIAIEYATHRFVDDRLQADGALTD